MYSIKLENLKGMVEFLDSIKSPKLKQEEVNNPNWPIASDETEIVIKKKKHFS